MRMSPERFDHLLGMVSPLISKQSTTFRKAIPAGERLSLTLRYLASGESQQSLSFGYRIGTSTVSQIISDTCKAIYKVLSPVYLRSPASAEEWLNIANSFEDQRDLPHVVGAIDGKHIRMKCPAESGTLFHNYKGYFSMVLLAVCDAKYCFTLVDIGQFGSSTDSGVLARSEMRKRFDDEQMNLPPPAPLEGCSFNPLPYFLVGDDIFPLQNWLMRPFPGHQIHEDKSIYNEDKSIYILVQEE